MKILGLNIPIYFGKPKRVLEVSPDKQKIVSEIPHGRSSIFGVSPDFISSLENGLVFVTQPWDSRIISLIRRLSWTNPDVGIALNDLVQLTNTGHKIYFDKTVPPEQVDKMRMHLENKMKTWGDGVAGSEGLINKLIAQIYISGAISGEWVPDPDLQGINNCILINPENITWAYNPTTSRYEPYQKVSDQILTRGKYVDKIKLNQITYKYFGLHGDTNEPYGIPPFLTALEALVTQKDMLTNVSYIVKQIGLLGFFEALLEKPAQQANESENAYKSRLEQLLTTTKNNIQDGLIDGTIVGYDEDHEFNFHSTTKNLNGIGEIFNTNEIQVANGLKYNPTFMGVNTKTEAALTIVFTKMLAQLKNIQRLIKAFLEYGYVLELQLAGYNFNYLRVEFKPSTITDDLKMQQGQEIKIRNYSALYAAGIISQETFADEMGFEAPDKPEPRVPLVAPETGEDAAKKKDRKKDKQDSDTRTRKKRKEQPKDAKPRT